MVNVKKRGFINFAALFILGLSGNDLYSSGNKPEGTEDLYNALPTSGFIENKGQMTDDKGIPVPFVLFKTSTPGADMYVTEQGLTYLFLNKEGNEFENSLSEEEEEETEKTNFKYTRIDMHLLGAKIKKENVVKENPSEANFNYYYTHCPKGIFGAKQYEKIIIREVYPGIDWVLYGSNKKGFKYDFLVHPGGDPLKVELVYSSLEPLRLNSQGDIEMKTEFGNLTEHKPVSFQSGEKIKTKFIKTFSEKNDKGGYDTHIKFSLENYDRTQPLIIDPKLVWGTFYGGTSFEGFTAMDCDPSGNVLVTCYAQSTVLPTQSWGTAYYNGVHSAGWDGMILKFSNTGLLIWATYYGSFGDDTFWAIKTNSNGDAYVTGITNDAGFPTQALAGAYNNSTFGGGGTRDVVVLKFSNTGTCLWSTYYGGPLWDEGSNIDVDAFGNVYVTGHTAGSFPTVTWAGAYNSAVYGGSSYDAFILRFSNTGSLTWATYYGGSGFDKGNSVDTDNAGNIYVTGETGSGNFNTQTWGAAYTDGTLGGTTDAFILRFTNTGVLDWSTYYGGSANERGNAVVADNSGNIYIMGYTGSSDFPVQSWGTAYYDNAIGSAGAQDAFVLRFSSTGTCDWSTYYGGTGSEDNTSNSFDHIELDNCDNVYVTVGTSSLNMNTLNPGCGSFFDNTVLGTSAFVIKFSKTGVLLWATYIDSQNGNVRSPLTTDQNNNLFVGGEATFGGFLINPGSGTFYDGSFGGGEDAFIMKLVPDTIVPTTAQVNPGSCICNGSTTINITCGIAPYNYIWSNGSQTLNTTNISDNLAGLCAGTYWVAVSDAGCNKDTLHYTLSGAIGGLTISATPIAATCSGPGSASVQASGGTGSYFYTWSSGQSVSTASGLAAGNYTVTITDSGGCSTSSLIIIPGSSSTPIINASSSAPLCFGDNNGSVSASFSNGISPYTYTWLPAGTTGTTPVNFNISNLSSGTYTLSVNDNTGCTGSQVIIITQPAVLSTTVSATNGSCGTNGTASAVVAGGTAPYTYSWSPSGGLTTSQISNLSSGTYTLVVNDNAGCLNSQVINITQPAVLSATISLVAGTCAVNGSASIVAAGGTGPYTYSWSVSGGSTTSQINNLPSGSYTVAVIDANACQHIQTFSVSGSSIKPIAAIAGPTTLCIGGNAVLSGSGGSNYIWNTTTTNSTINVSPTSTSTYTLFVSNGVCADTAIYTLTVNPLPVILFTADTTEGCSPLCLNFTNTTNNTQGTSWSFGDGNTSQQLNPPYCYTDTGSFSVALTVTDNNGCSNTLTKNNYITVHPTPNASFTANPQPTTILSPQIYFTDQSTGAAQWHWTFGDVSNSSSSQQNPAYTYQDTGRYSVELIVSNQYGCADTITEVIIIDPDVTLFAPNTFTPNGDGINDNFSPRGTGIDERYYELYIFDRWGNLIFKATNPAIGWDGRANGGKEIAQIDTYVWKLAVKDILGKKHQYVGHLNLIR